MIVKYFRDSAFFTYFHFCIVIKLFDPHQHRIPYHY